LVAGNFEWLTVQDEERRQIALELHNSTMQHLAAIRLNMMSLKARATFDGKARELWKDIEDSVEDACRELRTRSHTCWTRQSSKRTVSAPQCIDSSMALL
jgi:signal transduction histidine kinase